MIRFCNQISQQSEVAWMFLPLAHKLYLLLVSAVGEQTALSKNFGTEHIMMR